MGGLYEILSRKYSETYIFAICTQLEKELDSANITISTLHSQLIELQQSDTILKAKQTHEESVSSLRVRHEKELFRLHQEIDKLKAEVKSKVY